MGKVISIANQNGGVGKTTLATKLVGFTLWSFSATLKAEVAGALGLSLLELAETKGSPATRKLLQAWGAIRRAQDPLYFIRPVHAAITASTATHHVIDDVRFPNELASLATLGTLTTIRVTRLNPPINPAGEDESEVALDLWPAELRLEAATGDWAPFEKTVEQIISLTGKPADPSVPLKGGPDEAQTSPTR